MTLMLTICIALRIEWCKARARAHRWQEECLLLREEMSRVILSFQYSARQWIERGKMYEETNATSQHQNVLLANAEIACKRSFLKARGAMQCSKWPDVSLWPSIACENGTVSQLN